MKLIGHSILIAALVFAGCQKRTASEEDDTPIVAMATPVPTPDYAPSGVFFLLAPIRKETKDGIVRLVPGTEVKLLHNGKYQTPEGEMALDPRLLTNDRTAARAAQNVDQKGQFAARPKSLPAARPVAVAYAPARTQPAVQATPSPTSADEQMRIYKFRLSVLKTEEAKLQANIDFLWEKAGHPNQRMAGAPSGLSSSSSLSDWNTLNAKLAAVRADISTLEAKLQEPPK